MNHAKMSELNLLRCSLGCWIRCVQEICIAWGYRCLHNTVGGVLPTENQCKAQDFGGSVKGW